MDIKKHSTLINLFFWGALILIGGIDPEKYELYKYQIILIIFWISGVLKFKDSENEMKESIGDSIKDLLFLIVMLPGLQWIGNSFKDELFEPIMILVHYGVLRLVLYNIKEDKKMVGSIVYIEYILLPVIAIILLRVGVAAIFSCAIPMICITIINRYIIKKSKRKLSKDTIKSNI